MTPTGKVTDPNIVLLGPRQYNRFLGNPPNGTTAEDAFQTEMGYSWNVQLMVQPLLDKVDQLEAKDKQLQSQVDQLKANTANNPNNSHTMGSFGTGSYNG